MTTILTPVDDPDGEHVSLWDGGGGDISYHVRNTEHDSAAGMWSREHAEAVYEALGRLLGKG